MPSFRRLDAAAMLFFRDFAMLLRHFSYVIIAAIIVRCR